MKRYNVVSHEEVENEKVDTFLHEIIDVCLKHNLSIGHEDEHGAFIVEDCQEVNLRWLYNAMTKISKIPV